MLAQVLIATNLFILTLLFPTSHLLISIELVAVARFLTAFFASKVFFHRHRFVATILLSGRVHYLTSVTVQRNRRSNATVRRRYQFYAGYDSIYC
jgi:hypothetical protein